MIYFVVPAFNEEENIGRFIAEVEAHAAKNKLVYRLIVVDDGSLDRTAQIVRAVPPRDSLSLLSYQPNRGVGEAFRQGLNRALGDAGADDIIVTLEADGTSDLNILPAMIEKKRSGAEVVLASCYAEGGQILGTTPWRMFMSRCANFLVGLVFRMKGIHTYSSFYRVYRPAALRLVLANYGDYYTEKGFACVVELLARLAKLGIKIAEVPMVLQGDRRQGRSKMKVLGTTFGYLRILARNAKPQKK